MPLLGACACACVCACVCVCVRACVSIGRITLAKYAGGSRAETTYKSASARTGACKNTSSTVASEALPGGGSSASSRSPPFPANTSLPLAAGNQPWPVSGAGGGEGPSLDRLPILTPADCGEPALGSRSLYAADAPDAADGDATPDTPGEPRARAPSRSPDASPSSTLFGCGCGPARSECSTASTCAGAAGGSTLLCCCGGGGAAERVARTFSLRCMATGTSPEPSSGATAAAAGDLAPPLADPGLCAAVQGGRVCERRAKCCFCLCPLIPLPRQQVPQLHSPPPAGHNPVQSQTQGTRSSVKILQARFHAFSSALSLPFTSTLRETDKARGGAGGPGGGQIRVIVGDETLPFPYGDHTAYTVTHPYPYAPSLAHQ